MRKPTLPKPIPLTPDDVLLTYAVAAEKLSISLATTRRMVRSGELRSVRIRRSVRIPQSELLRYIADNAS
jgi:excisionase family DNA binding protein